VREAVPAFEGELLELRGDEALCVFRSARQALRASVELQRRLRTETDDEPAFPIGVGMGLDAGEAVPTQGGYRGAALNLAARLCAQAKPGEVLATESVAHFAHRVDGLRLIEGRSTTLKGIARPVRFVTVKPETPLPPLPSLPGLTSRRLWSRRIAAVGVGALAVTIAVLVYGLGGLGSAGPALALGQNEVGAIRISGSRLHAPVRVGSEPSALAVGAGAVWVANGGSGTLSRLDPASGQVVDTVPVGNDPTAVAVGGGAVWVLNSGDGTLSRFDPQSQRPAPSTLRVGNGPVAITADRNHVWVVDRYDASVVELSPSDGRVTHRVPIGLSPNGATLGYGRLWVADETGSVFVVDPTIRQVTAQIPTGIEPGIITAGDGAIWVTARNAPTLVRIDPNTDHRVRTIQLTAIPTGMAIGQDAVWVAQPGGIVDRVDTRTGLIHSFTVGGAPDAVAVGGGAVWLASIPRADSHQGGTLRVAAGSTTTGMFTSIDPDATDTFAELDTLINVYDGLITYRRVGGLAGAQLVPDLGQAMPVISNAGRTYTFQVRRGIRYSDGTFVRPEDVRRGIERAFQLQSWTVFQAGYYTSILGAHACMTHPQRCSLRRGIATNDHAYTITFNLAHPDPRFLYELALGTGDAISPKATARDTGHSPLPATGPYMIQSWRGTTVTLVRNPKFHVWSSDAQPAGYPDKIIVRTGAFHPIQQTADVIAEHVREGTLDYADDWGRPGPLVRWFLFNRPDELHVAVLGLDNGSIVFTWLDSRTPPFNSLKARQALAYALNRRAMAKHWEAGAITCQITPPGFPGFVRTCPYTRHPNPGGGWTAPNLAKARRLIAASHTHGANVGAISPSPETAYLVHVLHTLGYHARQTASTSGHAKLGVEAWGFDWTSPSNLIVPFLHCHAPINFGHFCNPSIDLASQHAEQLQLTSPTLAGRLWAQIDRRVIHLAPIIPFVNPNEINLTSMRTGDYQYNPHYGALYDQMWIK
jgi:peptide/nickel transport system substrate-binding protein